MKSSCRRRTLFAALLVASASLARGDDPPVAMSVAELLALPRPTAGVERTVVVRGVVTLAEPPIAIQDGEHGVFVIGPATGDAAPAVGDEVEITGGVEWTTFAPRVRARALRILGRQALPEPQRAGLARLFGGGYEATRIEVVGVVQGIRRFGTETRLLFESESRALSIEIDRQVLATLPANLVDADVRVVGVGKSIFNTRGEFIAPSVQVARAEDVAVIVPAPAPPFECFEVPLREIGGFRSRPFLGHRFRTRGTVSFAVPGVVFLLEGNGGVRVETAGGRAVPHGLRAGDRVEVAGFLSMSRQVGGLFEAEVRRIESGPPPQPLPLDAATIVNTNLRHRDIAKVAPEGSYDGCLVRCTGQLEGIDTAGPAITLALNAGGTLFNAVLYEPLPVGRGGPWPPIGSEVAVTGIVEIDRDPVATGEVNVSGPILRRLDIILRDPADVALLRAPPWWTPARLAVALGGLATVAASAGVWVVQLRREVRRQTAIAVAESTARREAALEYEITLRERNRIAANLHDTVLQSLTGIGFQLKACGKNVPDTPDERDDSPAAHLAIADRMVDHAAGQLRSTVWSLRALQADGRPFSEALDDLADALGAGHNTRIEVRVDPTADELPVAVTGNVLLVIQEAIHNALHHAAPRLIAVEAVVDRTAGALAVAVRDDGSGFAPGAEPGPKQGHFGLAGMRERVGRLGGTLSIASGPGQGTAVTATVPLAGHDDSAEERS